MSPKQTKCVHLRWRASAITASSASRLEWMSLKIANRIATPVKPPKRQNVTTEARGRINVLMREMNFVTATDLRDSVIESLNACPAYQEFVGPPESPVCLQGTSNA